MSEKFHSLEEKKRPKFLVSWVEDSGLVRGQTCQTREDSNRLMKHLETLDTTLYAEVRRIGSKLGCFSKRVTAQ